MIFIFLAMIAGVVFGLAIAISNGKAVARLKQRIVAKYGLKEVFVSPEDRSLVGFNFGDRKIVLASGNSLNQYDFASIVSVEVVENGTSVTQTHRGSQLLGAAVGGLTFGPLGAVVGGLSGKSRSKGRVRGISLKVVVDDQVCPVYLICFLRCLSKEGLDPDSLTANQARRSVDRFHAHILNAMRQSQLNASTAPSNASTTAPAHSYADELQKLWDLKQVGILNAEEFVALKSRLVGGLESRSLEQLESKNEIFSGAELETKKTKFQQGEINCQRCGSRLENDARFCTKCGIAV